MQHVIWGACLLDNMGELVSQQTHARLGVGCKLSGGEANVFPEGESTGIERRSNVMDRCVVMDSNAAEVVTEA